MQEPIRQSDLGFETVPPQHPRHPPSLGQRWPSNGVPGGEWKAGKLPPPLVPPPVLIADGATLALERLRLRTWISGECTVAAPFGLVGPTMVGGFFAVTEGRMLIQPSSLPEPVEIRAGDVAVLGSGIEHSIMDSPSSPKRSVGEYLTPQMINTHQGFSIPGPGPVTKFFAGMYLFAEHAPKPLRLGLPPVTVLRADASDQPPAVWQQVLQMLRHQVTSRQQGTHAIMNHLVSILFIEAVRVFLNEPGRGNLAEALLDEHIGPVLSLVHAAPAKPWTSEELANEAGLSRTLFHERFGRLVGQSPHQYIISCRMHQAVDLLEHTNFDVATIATRCGYGSESAFCTAFKRFYATTPGEWRASPTVRRWPGPGADAAE